MREELISVIVPVYNVENYLDKCLESITNQTYRHIEIILLDDGSTDGSGIKCDEWAERDWRIRVIHKKNEGLSETRNKGLKEAKGKYIAWVDSDDYVDNQFLEKLYKLLIENNADMSMCNFYGLYGDTLTFDGASRIFDATYTAEEFLEKLYTTGFFSVVWNKLVVKDAYKNICFPINRRFEDSAVMRELALKCSKIVSLKEPLYYYRRHDKSITLMKRNHEEAARYLKEYCQWLEDDIVFFITQGNNKLISQASKYLCNAIIKHYKELSAQDKRLFKAKYNLYVGNVIKNSECAFKVKLKYFMAYINIRLYNTLEKLL